MLKAINSKFSINKYKKLTLTELEILKTITGIINETKEPYLEIYIPLIKVQRYLKSNNVDYSIRQIRYNIDKLIQRELISRRVVLSTEIDKVGKPKIIKRCWYRVKYRIPERNRIKNLPTTY